MLWTDQQVVAAVNSCLDLDKLKQLPLSVRERFKTLLQKNRVKAVCFFEECGLGLRVYHDVQVTNIYPHSGDEAKLLWKSGENHLDLDGLWVRCPAELFKEEEGFRVINEYGRRWFKGWAEDDEGDETCTPIWGGISATSRIMTKEEAEEVLRRLDGKGIIVPVEKDTQ